MSRPWPSDASEGPHVFVDDLAAPVLSEWDRHHLARVLRLRPGDPLSVSDGRGRWRPCRFGRELEAAGPVREVAPPEPPITVAFAPAKGDRPELVTRKLTELGVDRIVPLATARSVVRWDEHRAGKRLARLRRVAREAAMQCRRCHLPEVAPVASVAAMAAVPGAALAHRGGDPLDLAYPVVLVGPEGGWAPEELALDVARVGLGPHVLRSETAAVAAGSLLTAHRAGLVATVRPHGG